MSILSDFMENYNKNVQIINGNPIMENATYGGPNTKYDICIAVDCDGRTDYGFAKDPYFKVYNKREIPVKPSKSDKDKITVARIYFDRAEYVKTHDGKFKVKDLDSTELKIMIKALNSPSDRKDCDTIWDELKSDLLRKIKTDRLSSSDINRLKNLEMPNYENL